MDQGTILNYSIRALILILELSMLPIVVATVVGLMVSLLQALTQVQEQTLSFAIKLITISITMLLAAQWMIGEMMLFIQDIFTNFPALTR